MKKLIIGTGPWTPQSDTIGIDILPAFNPDIVRDVTLGLPFDDNKFDEIEIRQVLEHIGKNEDYYFVMKEIYRCLRPGGTVYITVPYFRDDVAVEASGHLRFFSENSFIDFYCNPYSVAMGLPQFYLVENKLEDTNFSGVQPARIVKIILKK